ncbi:lipid-A-disaccharide synthase [bacterium BRH_c32]|nr:MAG: lipid-A-disaccharide synthase [bacterium BRH_c32]
MTNILIIAGEASGDLHGEKLMREINALDNSITFFGIGGDKMKSAGLISFYSVSEMAFLGFWEVVKHLPFIRKVKKELISAVIENNIKTVILIDYPGFNLNIAKKFKSLGVKVIYYISPQLWAWGQKRVEKVRTLVDKMIVIFEFEKEFYKKHGIEVEFSGHPLIDRLEEYTLLSKKDFISKNNLDASKEILLLLPGSRKQEISRILPDVIKAAEKIANEFNMQIVVANPDNIDRESYSQFAGDVNFKIISGYNYELFSYSKFGIIKSGTSTIEASIFLLPFIVVYKTSGITYTIGKSLIKLDNIAMANIIAGENIVEELIQNDVSEDNVYNVVKKYLDNNRIYEELKDRLKIVKEKVGIAGGSKKAAQIILQEINEN